MKKVFIMMAIGAICMGACKNEEKPCPANDLQTREDSLNRREELLLVRERALAEREAAAGMNAGGGTAATGADNGADGTVKTASESTVTNYKANVGNAKGVRAPEPKVAYKKSSAANPGQYPEASERLLTEKDMQYQTAWGKKVMLNEIYARKGMIFKEDALLKHFRKESWYKGKKAGIPKNLSAIEKQNIEFIQAHQ